MSIIKQSLAFPFFSLHFTPGKPRTSVLHRDSCCGLYLSKSRGNEAGEGRKVWLPGDRQGHGRKNSRMYLSSYPSPTQCNRGRQSNLRRRGVKSKDGGQVLERGGKHKLKNEVKVSGEMIDQMEESEKQKHWRHGLALTHVQQQSLMPSRCA